MAQSLSSWEQLIESLTLRKKPANLTIGNELNRGAWGIVYDGVLGRRPVAVKAIHENLFKGVKDGDNAVRNFCIECDRLEAMEDNHVIKFLGAFKDAKLGPILVMEKMKENLRQFLERHRDKDTLIVLEQLRISLEITQGVAFLHQLNPPMVHRDLNDKNVMFTFDGVAKIGDFGQSKLKRDLYLTTDLPGMIPFMPPEALQVGNSKYDESLDIFSLGVLMVEIGTQQPPVPNIMGIGTTVEVKRRETDLGRMSLLHPLKPFILLCLSDSPKQRPKAFELQMIIMNLHESQQEVARLKRTQRELEGVQQAHIRTRRELSKTQQELSKTQQEFEGVQQAHTRTQQELSKTQQELDGVQQELEKTTSAVQKLSDSLSAKEKCLETHHANQKKLQKELQAKSEELKGAQVQLRDLHSELTFLSEENKHLKESLNFKQSATVMSISNENNPTVHCSTKTPQRQWDLDNAYLGVQDKSTIQTTITRCLHSLEVQIFDSVAKADFPDGSFLHATCLRYSQGYKDWELGYGIILCAVLQLCYEVCRTMLSNDVVHDAVGAYNDGRSFAPEVVAMLKDSLAELDSSVLADTACHLVADSFSVNACTEQNNSRRYAAVYSLITAYLKNPVQDYLASAKQAVLADRDLGFVTANPCVEEFVKKVLPSCWELATMYMPPIFACDQNVKVNGALHDLSQVSSLMGMVQSYLFPLVYYCGEVQKKARVLAEMP